MSKRLLEGLTLGDGQFLPLAEIDAYLGRAPQEYPGLGELRLDMELAGIRKMAYLLLTHGERLKKAQAGGCIIMAKYPANPSDIYYGSGVIPVDPFVASMAQIIFRADYSLASEGRERLSPEACAWQAAGNAAIRRGILPLDSYGVYMGPWCTNSPYNGEDLVDVVPHMHFVDQPFFPHRRGKGENALKRMVGEIRAFVESMEQLTGKKVSEDDLAREVRTHNRLRGKIRQLMDYLLLEHPPLGALDTILAMLLSDDWQGDPVAAENVLDTILIEAEDRVQRGVRAPGVPDDAMRIFFAGITTCDIRVYNLIEDLGGTLAGLECVWNIFRFYLALAQRDLSIPFAQPMGQRASLVAELAGQMKADGSIFDTAFGCNYISKTARCVTDAIRREVEIPTVIIDTDLPGENRQALEEQLEGFLEIVREAKDSRTG
ncbi:MAG: 2-hydroxyacyl-CoA dehydratase [Candidatus Binatia bacterium]